VVRLLTPANVVASVDLATTTTTRTSLPLRRELVAAGRLVHDGGTRLAAQVDTALVVESAAGGLTLSTRSGRTDPGRQLGGGSPGDGQRLLAVLRVLTDVIGGNGPGAGAGLRDRVLSPP
jgi:hypothetical protein